MRLRRRSLALAVAAVAAVLALTGCAGGSDSSGGAGAGDFAAPAPAERPAAARDESAETASTLRNSPQEQTPAQPAITKSVISTGNVSLRSDDVEKTAFDVQAIVDRYAGELTQSDTRGAEGGKTRLARMVLRIPAEDFGAAFAELRMVADELSAKSSTEDVTTQVIDTEVRIRAQERSLRRIEVLLDEAVNLRTVVAIESELTRRQSDLDSLKQQQAYLADQTSMSTITVNVERASEPTERTERDEAGFLSGLDSGWEAMTSFGTGLATLSGALLPFAVLLALLGVPLWLGVRRVAGRRRVAGQVEG